MIARAVVAFLVLVFSASALAHKPSDSYLTLRVDGAAIDGRWDIAVRDLDAVFDLDRNGDGRVDWGELRRRTNEIDDYAASRLVALVERRALSARNHRPRRSTGTATAAISC